MLQFTFLFKYFFLAFFRFLFFLHDWLKVVIRLPSCIWLLSILFIVICVNIILVLVTCWIHLEIRCRWCMLALSTIVASKTAIYLLSWCMLVLIVIGIPLLNMQIFLRLHVWHAIASITIGLRDLTRSSGCPTIIC